MSLAEAGRRQGTRNRAPVVSRSVDEQRSARTAGSGPGLRHRGVDPLDDEPTPGPEVPGAGDEHPAPRRRAGGRRAATVAALLALVAATVGLRVELGDRRADARNAAAAEARMGDGRRDVALVAEAVAAQLVRAHADGEVAAADREAQVARLAELGLTEADMEQALDDAQELTVALEGRRDALTVEVERQAVEDVELQTCVAEVRSAVDAAFHSRHRAGVEVPATREICRVLAGVP